MAKPSLGNACHISIVVPFHNEEENVEPVLDHCLLALSSMPGKRCEIIAINDGSTDRTGEILRKISERDGRVRILAFSRNCGQAPALYHGLRMARGEILVTLDGDGQNNPGDIPAMIERLESSGADLVSGVRVDRRDSRLRRWMSRLANRIRRSILDDGVTDSGCALKVFRRSVVDSLIPIRTLYSFIPALAKAAGNRIEECPVDHRERQGGQTHYGLRVMLWRPALDLLGVWWFSRRRFPILETSGEKSPPDSETGRGRGSGSGVKTAMLLTGLSIVFLTQLGSYPLLEPDEGRYAEIGREMAEPGGDWIVPSLNGIPHFQKPPMIYWFTAISQKVFGASEIAARLPSALSAIATLFLTLGIARRLFQDRVVERYALIILASSPLFLFLGRTLTPDMHLTFWITASIFCLVRSRPENLFGEPNHRPLFWGWMFFLCLGLGFLTKGPMAFVIPLSAAIGSSISLRRYGIAKPRLPWMAGIP
ncbi:MAG: glycosyltransferase, partial [Verrucomicrobiae bacterium]|nr:glycosyltransferase [Verrucomicrobiae bacterium]